MLVCRRRKGECLVFRDEHGREFARVEVHSIRARDVSLSIDAPPTTRIVREELEEESGQAYLDE